MVAIVAGNGLGLLNTSLNILGGAGVLGQIGQVYDLTGLSAAVPLNGGAAHRLGRGAAGQNATAAYRVQL